MGNLGYQELNLATKTVGQILRCPGACFRPSLPPGRTTSTQPDAQGPWGQISLRGGGGFGFHRLQLQLVCSWYVCVFLASPCNFVCVELSVAAQFFSGFRIQPSVMGVAVFREAAIR